jgi:hypothetical protein
MSNGNVDTGAVKVLLVVAGGEAAAQVAQLLGASVLASGRASITVVDVARVDEALLGGEAAAQVAQLLGAPVLASGRASIPGVDVAMVVEVLHPLATGDCLCPPRPARCLLTCFY